MVSPEVPELWGGAPRSRASWAEGQHPLALQEGGRSRSGDAKVSRLGAGRRCHLPDKLPEALCSGCPQCKAPAPQPSPGHRRPRSFAVGGGSGPSQARRSVSSQPTAHPPPTQTQPLRASSRASRHIGRPLPGLHDTPWVHSPRGCCCLRVTHSDGARGRVAQVPRNSPGVVFRASPSPSSTGGWRGSIQGNLPIEVSRVAVFASIWLKIFYSAYPARQFGR